jgi:hypothetical protein
MWSNIIKTYGVMWSNKVTFRNFGKKNSIYTDQLNETKKITRTKTNNQYNCRDLYYILT